MLLLGLAWQNNGCRSTGYNTEPVEQYLKLAASLSERDPDFLDFYVGPVSLARTARSPLPPLDQIEQNAKHLQGQLSKSDLGAGRIAFLNQQLNAMSQRVRQLQ